MSDVNIFQQSLNNIKRIKQSDAAETFVEKTRLALKGSAIGLVAGLMYGWYYKKNIYITGLVGAISGGVINYIFIETKKEI